MNIVGIKLVEGTCTVHVHVPYFQSKCNQYTVHKTVVPIKLYGCVKDLAPDYVTGIVDWMFKRPAPRGQSLLD